MAKLDDITRDVVNSVDGALGCAVVDLSSGLLLSVYHNVPYFTFTYLEAVAAAAVDMMRGKNVQAVESLLSNQRGSTVDKTIQEIQMTTNATYHFMSTVKDKPDALLVLITSKKANLGMGWAAVRKCLPVISPLIP
ncbi:MAG: hypothetical protein WC782_03640 [Methylococcaceae bacterium]|jgi:hypothetical protein